MSYSFPINQPGQELKVFVKDQNDNTLDMALATDIVVFWVTPGGFEHRPNFTIEDGAILFILDGMTGELGTYYFQASFVFDDQHILSDEIAVEGVGQPWVPLREPILHYRVSASPHGQQQWQDMSKQDLLDMGVRVFDIMYEIDTGRWKIFNGRSGYDELNHVSQTQGAIDHLLNVYGQVNIINMALGRLGQAPIADVTDNKPGARLGQMYYRITVSEVIAAYEWSSAVVRRQLSLVPDEVLDNQGFTVPNPERNHFTGFGLQYYIPSAPKPIRVMHLFSMAHGAYQRSDTEFRIEGDYLYTNLPDAGLVYVGDYSAQTGQLDPFVVELIVLRLAARMAFNITSSERMTRSLMEEYNLKLAEAQFADASRSRESTNQDVFPTPNNYWVNDPQNYWGNN